jgi:two-component system, cell cycle sensor histidine kinase and response regulator CckA
MTGRAGTRPAKHPPGTRPVAEGPRVPPAASLLLVDDEPLVRSLVARGLRRGSYEVTDVSSAEAALDVLADPGKTLDLLITDVHMAGIDGIELARRARALRPGLRVLLISGSPDVPTDSSGSAYPLLLKPFGSPELLAAVEAALGRTG